MRGGLSTRHFTAGTVQQLSFPFILQYSFFVVIMFFKKGFIIFAKVVKMN